MSRSDSAPCIASEVTGLFGIAERPKILSGPRPTLTPSFKVNRRRRSPAQNLLLRDKKPDLSFANRPALLRTNYPVIALSSRNFAF